MLRERREGESPILVDHMSSHGTKVTHVRGILLVKSLENMRQAGFYERYKSIGGTALRERVESILASSWAPIELCEQHYDVCDRMQLSDPEVERLGESMGQGIGSTTMALLLKSTRRAGVESNWSALKQCDRFWDRSYLGGGVTLLKVGPKDSIMEYHGIPLAKSRYWRTGARAFWLGIAQLTARSAYVRLARPRSPSPDRIAFAGSWV